MLAYGFIKYWIGNIWFFEEEDVIDYVVKVIETAFGLIPMLLIAIIDLIFSPIEIIAIIIYKVRRTKQWMKKKQ